MVETSTIPFSNILIGLIITGFAFWKARNKRQKRVFLLLFLLYLIILQLISSNSLISRVFFNDNTADVPLTSVANFEPVPSESYLFAGKISPDQPLLEDAVSVARKVSSLNAYDYPALNIVFQDGSNLIVDGYSYDDRNWPTRIENGEVITYIGRNDDVLIEGTLYEVQADSQTILHMEANQVVFSQTIYDAADPTAPISLDPDPMAITRIQSTLLFIVMVAYAVLIATISYRFRRNS